MSITIRKTPCPDVTLNINSTPEGTFAAGSTIDVNLTDGVNPVTPDSVTVVGNVVTVQVPACPPAVTRSTATLMKTGQTTSYRTGDDGDIEAGRATDFLTLDATPVHNNGSATLNTTTNRFTDINGLQVYGDNIVLDWSTWDGSTLLGWRRTSLGVLNWNNGIDNSLALTHGGFSVWRMPNNTEINSIADFGLTAVHNYAPFNINTEMWSSTTYAAATSSAWRIQQLGSWGASGKANTRDVYPVRTFTLSTSNILS